MPVYDYEYEEDYQYYHDYYQQQECSWAITVDVGYVIRITIEESTIGGAYPWQDEYVLVRAISL